MNSEQVGKLLILAGMAMVVAGLIFWAISRFFDLTQFPGTFMFEREGSRFYVPIGISIAVSLVLTILLNLWFFVFRK